MQASQGLNQKQSSCLRVRQSLRLTAAERRAATLHIVLILASVCRWRNGGNKQAERRQ